MAELGGVVILKPLNLAAAAAVTTLAICGAGVEHAKAVSFYGANGYEFVAVSNPFIGNNNSWATASAAASASTYSGVNGHLATITSQGENDFLFGIASGLYTGFAGSWLGGKAPEGWLVGPDTGSFGYTNWFGIEPNNNGFAYVSIGTTNAPGQWADDNPLIGGAGVPDPTADPVVGYFVEYENVAPVPSQRRSRCSSAH